MNCHYETTTHRRCAHEATHRVVSHVLDPGCWDILEGSEVLRRLNDDVIPYPNEPFVPQGPIMMRPEFCLTHAMEVMEARTQAWTETAQAARAQSQTRKVPKAA